MRILISGAGIAGPTLAWWLARLGHRITVLDKSASMRATGQNIDISGSAITVVKNMNLLHEVRRWNTTEKGTQIVNGKGEGVAKFPLREGGLSGTNEFEILRGDLAGILFRKAECENIEWRFGTTIKRVLENGEKNVKVEYSSGEEDTFDLLVAADGQWSTVRKQIFEPDSITAKDLGMFCVFWSVPREEGDNDWWNVYAGLDRRCVTSRPDPHNTIRVMLTHMPTTKEKHDEWAAATRKDRKTQEELVRRDFGADDVGWEMPRFLRAMERADDFYYWPMLQVKMDSWATGRVVCLGDAAYAPTPLTGSGTPLAIIGAYCLAGELSKLSNVQTEDSQAPSPSYDDIRAALEAYEALYHPWVSKIQNSIPPLFPGIMHPRTRFQRWLLTLFFKALARVFSWEWVQRRIGVPDMEANHDGFLLPHYPEMVRVQDKVG